MSVVRAEAELAKLLVRELFLEMAEEPDEDPEPRAREDAAESRETAGCVA